MSLSYALTVPGPIKNNHKITAHYKGSDFPPRVMTGAFVDIQAGYNNEGFGFNVKTTGSKRSTYDTENVITVEWGVLNQTSKVNSHLRTEKKAEKIECYWDLSTPYHINEKTLNVQGNYYAQDIFKIVHASVRYPESQEVIIGDVAFVDLTNMKGSVNSSLPIFNVTWFDVNFDFDTQNEESGKFIKVTWPENYALLDSKSTFHDRENHKEWKGTIKTELPLYTKHNIQIIYGLEVNRKSV